MIIDSNQLLERFLRYVRIDTEACEGSGTYPSSPGQLVLGKMLCEELKALGLGDAKQSSHGIVTATIPSNLKQATPTIAFLAHMDTSPETSGKNVQPIVHHNYPGGDIILPGDSTKVLSGEDPELKALVGKTIITTDGTTLLGSDNKSGVAVIMQMASTIVHNPQVPHGPIKICFTCDEEIGHGTDHIDLKELNALVGYTLDGGKEGEIEAETFSADKATVTITGVNIHPSIGKGKMVNAVRLAGKFIDRLPQRLLSPETTEGREGFIHPYKISGSVWQVTIEILLRDFITERLMDEAEILRQIARQIVFEYPQAKIDVKVDYQYRNMADGLKKEPRAVALAVKAMEKIGIKPHIGSIRGGTDGSQLTTKGLPTPNLFTAEHYIHSPKEWTCLEEMESACKTLVELVQLWGQEKA
ncbi:peptidase T [Telmatocola sphagniphila]|uniref:Peptidase T n=1 Tax=Telmatocola sphagniphila TaxID=1123043 RepID=A0A8E6B878_9BACT|nr:peptidase T [Telmatocola sphagniphila]QVL32210.1 peptidase T [Telmatocola sphagniphila]